ncbi:MAG: AMP-binding protein [Flavobacteriia bacterium]|nr:AMP-binding protein [Flavobacteriia bacterium]
MSNFIPKIIINNFEFLTSDQKQKMDIYTFIEEWNNDSDNIEIQTSGSTGVPKSFVFYKKHLIESAKATLRYFKSFSDYPILLCLSANTIGGKMQIIRSLVWDKKILILPLERNPIKNLNQKSSFLTLTPIQLNEILQNTPEKLDLIDKILLGAAPIDDNIYHKIQHLKTLFFQGFGMSESLSHFAIRKLNNHTKSIQSIEKIPYQLLEKVELIHESNDFFLTIPYLDIKNLLLSDDFELVDKNLFFWKGRKDWLINSGGYKFNPEILEKKLQDIILNPYFIIGEKNEIYHQIVTLFIEEENHQINIEELKLQMYKRLKRYEIPKKIIQVGRFLYTESGKIDRLKTQNKYLENKI